MVLSSSISSSKRRFAVKLAIFCALLVALDAGVGTLLRHYYFRQSWGLSFRTTYAIDQSNEDLIVMGSSRAQANYVPAIFRDALEMTCYNAGRDGQSLLYARAVQAAMLSRHKPTAIVLDLIPIDFFQYGGHYELLSALLPYYRTHPEIRPIVELRSKGERIKLLSQIYPFNSLPLQIARYNLTQGVETDGHVPQRGTMALPVLERDLTPPRWAHGALDPNMTAALREFVAACRESEVQLFVVVAPVYDGVLFGREALKEIEAILAPLSVEIWDYSDQDGIANDPSQFRDVGHLNQAGAEKFSTMVAARLRRELETTRSPRPDRI